jgi:hypothetical protein
VLCKIHLMLCKNPTLFTEEEHPRALGALVYSTYALFHYQTSKKKVAQSTWIIVHAIEVTL